MANDEGVYYLNRFGVDSVNYKGTHTNVNHMN